MAMKGALLNALLFPGWGEIYLKKYGRGILIISGMIAGILSILLLVVQETMTVLKSTPFDKTTLSPATLLQLSLQVIRSLNLSGLLIILLFMIILWIISIIDAYRLGREAMAKLNTDADQ
jgi:TM2 domain-containing membrane protein YozV